MLLTWRQNPERNVTYYIVYKTDHAGGSLKRIGTMTQRDVTKFPIVPFVDSHATTDYYRVRAVNSAGLRGPLSVEVCGSSVGHTC